MAPFDAPEIWCAGVTYDAVHEDPAAALDRVIAKELEREDDAGLPPEFPCRRGCDSRPGPTCGRAPPDAPRNPIGGAAPAASRAAEPLA